MPPQPSATEPQFLPEHAVLIGVLLQPQMFAVPVPAQVSGDVHVPHAYVPPQPFGTEPQFLPEHAVAIGVGEQPHTFGVPPPPQLCGEVQLPHEYIPPQPFETEPHLPAQAVVIGVGTH